MEKINFLKVKHDINGNPRYVCHFLTISKTYPEAVFLANKIGGRKYTAKHYGGGIVFQSYSLNELLNCINEVTGKNYSGYNLK